MTKAISIGRSAAFLAVLAPASVLADVTAEDVWQNTQDYISVFGGELSAEVADQGNGLSISDLVMTLTLPLEAGKVMISAGDFDLQETGDGTVEIIYPQSFTYGLTYIDAGGTEYSGDLELAHQGMTAIASGNPGDVTYDYSADRLDMSMGTVPLPDGGELTSMTGYLLEMIGQTRVTVGEDVKIANTYAFGENEYRFEQRASDGFGGFTESVAASGSKSLKGAGGSTIPRETEITNLAKALRNGLSLAGDYVLEGYFSDQTVTQDGQSLMTQSATSSVYGTTIQLDTDGLVISGPASDFEFSMEMPALFPLPMQGRMDEASGRIALPLLESDEFAPVEITMAMKGIALDEALWGVFDPGQLLPRDPADLSLSLTGTAKNNVEWLDFLNVETALANLSGMPVDLNDATLNDLTLRAAGAEINGTGAFTFDNTDLTSYPGMPRPDGTASFEIRGLDGLVEALADMGLLGEQELGGYRMFKAMMTSPVGDDHVTSTVEMTPEGHLLVNGNRLK